MGTYNNKEMIQSEVPAVPTATITTIVTTTTITETPINRYAIFAGSNFVRQTSCRVV